MPVRPDEITVTHIREEAERLEKGGKLTTHKETWKAFERRVSADFYTTRTPLSGMVKTITNSDTLHPKIYIECKYRNEDFMFWDAFEEYQITNKGRICVLCIENEKTGELIHLYNQKQFFKLIQSEIDLTKCQFNSNKSKSVLSLYRQTEDRAKIESKIPVVAIKKKHRNGYLIGIHPKHLVELQKILKNALHGRNS